MTRCHWTPSISTWYLSTLSLSPVWRKGFHTELQTLIPAQLVWRKPLQSPVFPASIIKHSVSELSLPRSTGRQPVIHNGLHLNQLVSYVRIYSWRYRWMWTVWGISRQKCTELVLGRHTLDLYVFQWLQAVTTHQLSSPRPEILQENKNMSTYRAFCIITLLKYKRLSYRDTVRPTQLKSC